MLVRFQPGPPEIILNLALTGLFYFAWKLFFSRFSMEFFVDVAEALVGYVGVYLGGSYAGVAEQGLYRTNVGAVLE